MKENIKDGDEKEKVFVRCIYREGVCVSKHTNLIDCLKMNL